MEGRNEIEKASRVWRECARTRETRRFIHCLGRGRGCKVRVELGSHHRHGRRCRIRGYLETHRRRNRRMGDSGRPGTPSPAKLEGQIHGGTRGLHASDAVRCEIRGTLGYIAGTAGRCEIRGYSEIHPPAPGKREFGETRRPRPRQSWKMRNSGTPEDSS